MRAMWKIPAAVTSVLLVTAACGDSVTETSGDELTQAEVEELSNEIIEGLSELFVGGFSGNQSALMPEGLSLSGAAAVPINITINESGSCEGNSGTVSVSGQISGSVDDQTGAGNLEFDFTQNLTNCAVQGEAHTFVVTGNPNLTFSGDFETDGQQSFNGTFNIEGGFSFVVDDGREGTCGVDLTTTVNATATSFSASTSGTVCGRTVNNQVVIGA